MDERITALLERLANEDADALSTDLAQLTDDEVGQMADDLRATYQQVRDGAVDGVDPTDLAVLGQIKAGVDQLNAEAARRYEAVELAAAAQAEAEAQAAALDAEMLGSDTGDEAADGASTAGDGEGQDPAPDDATAQAAATPEVDPAPAATQAATRQPAIRRPSLADMAARRPAEAAPRVEVHGPRWQTLDGGDVGGMRDIAERIVAAQQDIANLSAPAGFQQKVPVVRLKNEAPAELTLTDDLEGNVSKLDVFTRRAESPDPAMQALVASGGWCAPGEPRYDIPSLSSAERPVRDGLVRMGATRGSINFVRAARLGTVLANQSGAAVTTWENTIDQTPGGSTKTRQTFACRSVETETLGAVVARARFGNFQQRAFPEDIAHDMELVMARHARVAEVRLMDALIGDINVDVTQTGVFGTARDLKYHLVQARSQISSVERASDSQAYRAILPREARDMVVADVTGQQASGETDALMVDPAWAERYLATTGINVIYAYDTPTGADAFVTNADNQNLADFPDNFEIPVFPDGHAVFADGGTLDLGIVRDSTLNDTNDYELFMETFEGLLWLGPFGLTLTLTTCPNGISQISKDVTGSICSGS